MAGSVSLSKKLGVRTGHSVVLLGAPERLALRFESEIAALDGKVARALRPFRGAMPAGGRAPVDSVVLFVDRVVDLEDRIGSATERLHPEGQIWVAWRSRRAADVTEDLVRRIGLTAGMVDTRVCPIDTVWSGMRLVIRPENRDALAYRLGPPRRTRRATVSGPGSALATARARRRS